MERKIIQIAVTKSNNNITTMVALCDDGTVWVIPDAEVKEEWMLFPRIPQTEVYHSPYPCNV